MSLPTVKHSSTTTKTTLALSMLFSAVFAASNAVAQPTSSKYGATPKQLNFNYAGVKYVSQNLDDLDCTQDGLNVYGSMDLNSGWYAQASFTDVSGDICGSSTFAGQGGYRTPFNNTFYMYGNIGFESMSIDSGGSDSGLILAGGLRGFVTNAFETSFELSHHTIGDGQTMIGAMGAYWFTSNIAGTIEASFGADQTTFGFGARMTF